jgi:hypothetical protein
MSKISILLQGEKLMKTLAFRDVMLAKAANREWSVKRRLRKQALLFFKKEALPSLSREPVH